MTDFSVILDAIQKGTAPKLDADTLHNLNVLSQLRTTQATAMIPGRLADMDPLGHPGYVKLAVDQVKTFVMVGAALDKAISEAAAELNIDPKGVPPELGRLNEVLPYVMGTGDLPGRGKVSEPGKASESVAPKASDPVTVAIPPVVK